MIFLTITLSGYIVLVVLMFIMLLVSVMFYSTMRYLWKNKK